MKPATFADAPVPTIAGTVTGLQTSQQTFGQALSAIETGVQEIINTLGTIPGDGTGGIPTTDLAQVIEILGQVQMAIGSPTSGSLAGEVEANGAAIATLVDTINTLNNTIQGDSSVIAQINTVVTSNAAAINNVDANVTSVGGQITALAAQVEALQQSIATLASIVGDFGGVTVPSLPSIPSAARTKANILARIRAMRQQ